VEAYKTGDNDEDIAHFYFKVANYIYYTQENFTDIIKRIANEKWGKNYALIGQDLGNNYIAKREDSSSAFHKICNSLNLEHFKSPEGISYFPVYCFIKGLKNKKGETIMPLYDPYTYRSFYKITEGEYYVFEFGTYFNLQPPKYTVKLLSDDRIFSTPREYELRASSRYDEISYPIVSSLLERDIWTSILFKTELKEKVNDKEPLNIHLEFLVKLRRKIIYRILDVLGDLGFGVGTGAIALKAAFPPQQMTWWYWPTILGYALWAMCKIIIKFWRG